MNNAIIREATAQWFKDVKSGHGAVTTESKAISEKRFSLANRVEGEDGSQTNPEELIAASAAACFSMALSKTLTERDTPPESITTRASVEIGQDEEGIRMEKLKLINEGVVPNLSSQQFDEAVQQTRHDCPLYRLISPGFAEVTVEAKLVSTSKQNA